MSAELREKMSRRSFLKLLVGVGAGAAGITGCLGPIENYLKQREREEGRIKPK